MLTEPDESYHGIVYTEQFGKAAYITKARTHLMRDLGAQASPQNAFLLNLGLENPGPAHGAPLQQRPAGGEVPGRPREGQLGELPPAFLQPLSRLGTEVYAHGTCGVVSFGVKGGREAATRFMDSLEMASIVTHVADLRHLRPPSGQHHPPPD